MAQPVYDRRIADRATTPSEAPAAHPAAFAGAGRATLLALAAAVALWLAACLPAVLGRTTFYYRDLAEVFIPFKAFGAAALHAGRIPATNPTWGLGQPFRGDPNADAFYPGNLLYLVLPFWSAFNLHIAVHWLLAALGMGKLSRALGQSREAAALAAITWGGSGWMLSMVSSIYSVTVIAAWLPFVMLGGVLGGRRGVAIGGLALGLAVLDAEPILVLGLVGLLVLAPLAHGARRGLLVVVAIVVCGALVGLPQLVATARVAPFTFRFGHGLLPSQVSTFGFHPARLLELVLPFPFGLPGHPGERGVWATTALPRLPLYLSIHGGIVALGLAIVGAARRRALAVVAVSGLLLACLGRLTGEAMQVLFAGSFRSPEKLSFLAVLALPLLAAEGLDRVLAGGARRFGSYAVGGAALISLGVVAVAARLVAGEAPSRARVDLLGQLAVAALLLALAAWAAARKSAGWLLLLQLAGLLQLRPLLLQVDPRSLRPAAPLPEARVMLPVEQTYPQWGSVRPPPPGSDASWLARREAAIVGTTPGVLDGRSYPLAGDFTGMSHRFHTMALFEASRAPWPRRVAWARLVGVDLLVAPLPVEVPGLTPRGGADTAGAPSYFFAVEAPAPLAWWPSRVAAATTPRGVFETVTAQPGPTELAVVPLPVDHHPGAFVRVRSASPDRLRIAVRGEGGLLVVRRAFQVLWRARSGGDELPVVPANLDLVGVVVPPGERQVVLEIGSRPEAVAAAIAAVAFVVLLTLAWPRSRAAPVLGRLPR